jgi:PEP-CTERM/exosortase A-associated glycosyltransferase
LMRILHLLHRSVPGTHGYAIRSSEIVTKQLEKGLEPLVITSPSQSPLGKLDGERSEYIDGVRYFRTCSDFLPPTQEVQDKSPVKAALRVLQNFQLLKTAFRVARTYRPSVIHGHSPFTCGLVANMVAKKEQIPSIYEMRGIWEDSHSGRGKFSENSLRYRAVRALDNKALRGASLCCAIGNALKAEIVSRGISSENIFIVPNGVDVKAFAPHPPDEDVKKSLGLSGKLLFGYIGYFFNYEGLDLLVDAMIRLAPQLPDLCLLLVGDGELMPTLRNMVAEGGISDRVVFTGRVPHNRVSDFYRICDFMVLPRRDKRETRLVTPLKPLEIMAMGKPLISSDVGGHLEMVEDGANGVLFRSEDVSDLVSKCTMLAKDRDLRMDLGIRARKWVEENRDWRVLVNRYITAYEKLTQGTWP